MYRAPDVHIAQKINIDDLIPYSMNTYMQAITPIFFKALPWTIKLFSNINETIF